MMIRSVPLAGLLSDGAAWTAVADGESGAIVLRHMLEDRFAKVVSVADATRLEGERDRIEWLAGTGIPGPRLLDWRATEHGVCLITSAVAGVPADRLNAAQLAQAWPSIIDTLVRLHSVPASSCLYDRTLHEMMALARATVAENRVHAEFLPQHLIGTPPVVILEGLERDLSSRQEQEASDAVVCHGDLCLPNILINTDTSLVTGLIDLGRLGRADPYADIALLLANAREVWPDEDAARRADDDFVSRYGITLDPERLDFYLRLDPLTW
ncbi:APH(3'') family aminoglycoside O-phosphotransferase [Micromonospora sp. WMMD1274]|uniref:APH(3'') family aminoglycoside O-phosphotransferase n=1 Tax=Micromonospora sp. WMMD1274 TaxID=3404116 RepID=UPI003B962715